MDQKFYSELTSVSGILYCIVPFFTGRKLEYIVQFLANNIQTSNLTESTVYLSRERFDWESESKRSWRTWEIIFVADVNVADMNLKHDDQSMK